MTEYSVTCCHLYFIEVLSGIKRNDIVSGYTSYGVVSRVSGGVKC